MAGVKVDVAKGFDRVIVTKPVYTDDAGRYEIHFTRGLLFGFMDRVHLRPSHVRATKPGFVEKDSCQKGRLGHAYRHPGPTSASAYAGIVYPGHPYRLDLVMVPETQGADGQSAEGE